MIVAPHGRSYGHYAVGLILNVIIFAALGPLIGFAVMSIVLLLFATGDPATLVWGPAFFMAFGVFSIPVAYLAGWKAAAVTGAVVAVSSSFIRVDSMLYVVGCATGATISPILMPSWWSAERGMVEALPISIAGALAALVCTRATRSFRLRPHKATQAT